MAARTGNPKSTSLAGRPPADEDAGSVGGFTPVPAEDAARLVFSPLNYGEAPQVGILGDTGTGKTTLAAELLVPTYLAMSPGHVFVIDDKERRARFVGQERRDVADLAARPIDPNGPRVIIFRGDPLAGVDADPEEVSELAWARARRGRKTLVVNDELVAGRREVIVNRQWRKGIKFIPQSYTKGRAVGVADLWGAQSPQDVPIEPFEQSNAIVTFKLAGLGLEKLRERNYLMGGVEDVIPRLPGMEAPPERRGLFVVLMRGQPWNRHVYLYRRRRAVGAPPASSSPTGNSPAPNL